MRAPEAPTAERAQAPPWMLTFSCRQIEVVHGGHGVTAKASLISNRSTFDVQPAFGQHLLDRTDRVRWEQGRLLGVRGVADDAGDRLEAELSACEALIRTIAAAPSEIDEELAAVTVPSLPLKAGFSVGTLSTFTAKGLRRCDHDASALVGDGDRRHFPVETAVTVGGLRASSSGSRTTASCASRVKP